MIYFYKRIPTHKIEKMHSYMHHFFTQLFEGDVCPYSHDYHLPEEFRPAVKSCKTSLDNLLREVCTIYHTELTEDEKAKLREIYLINTDIEGICDKRVTPCKYEELPEKIRPTIKDLYGSKGTLWQILSNSDDKKYSSIKEKCGKIRGHFDDFRQVNEYHVCPFCGMEGLANEFDEARDDYDHYLPKALYPFCSITFDNLYPICDKCNKRYKKEKDIPYKEDAPSIQTQLYYPYKEPPGHQIKFSIQSPELSLEKPGDWELEITCTPAENEERKEAWRKIYGIDSRYKAYFSKYSKHIKTQVIKDYGKECVKPDFDIEEFKRKKIAAFKDPEYLQTDAIRLKCLYEFLLTHPKIENNLKGIV